MMQQLIDGYRISQIVCVAAELGIADLLKAGPRTWSELAAQTGAHPAAFRRLMRALCGLGVFTPVPPDSFALNVRCGDLADMLFEPASFDLVHAALLLEYLDWQSLLGRWASALKTGGIFNLVIQRPSGSVTAVTPTGWRSG